MGPAPADAVTTYAVDAPVRTHTKITPRLHRIEPELQVNKVPYDVPVAVPVPVERTVVHTQHVPEPTKLPFHVPSQSHNPTRYTQSNKLLKLQSSTRRLSLFTNPLYTLPSVPLYTPLLLPQP